MGVNGAFACSCSLPRGNKSIKAQVEKAHKESAAVFVGEVIEIVKKPNTYFVTVKLKVEKTWSNEYKKEVFLVTGQGGGDCGYKFEIGKKYLIYAYYGNKNMLQTNICTRTSDAEQNEDIAFLNRIKKPKVKSSPK